MRIHLDYIRKMLDLDVVLDLDATEYVVGKGGKIPLIGVPQFIFYNK